MLQPRPPRDQWCVDGSSGEQRRTSAPSQRAVADVVGEIPEQGVARVTRWIDHARFYSLVASYVEVVAKPNIRIADIRCQPPIARCGSILASRSRPDRAARPRL